MNEVWQQIAIQIPIVAAMALLILQLRKLESGERASRDEKWQAFLAERDKHNREGGLEREKLRIEAQDARDEQWRACLTGMSETNKAVNTMLIAQLETLGTQMQAVLTQMQAVQVSVERARAREEAQQR